MIPSQQDFESCCSEQTKDFQIDVQKTFSGKCRKELRNIFSLEKDELIKDEALDLAIGLLSFNPDKRLTAREALVHPYFANFDEVKNERYKNAKQIVQDEDLN